MTYYPLGIEGCTIWVAEVERKNGEIWMEIEIRQPGLPPIPDIVSWPEFLKLLKPAG